MSDEFQLHIQLRAADLVRSGLTPEEAARRARHEFGMTEVWRAPCRALSIEPTDALKSE